MRAYLHSAWNTPACWVRAIALPILLIFLASAAGAAQSIPGQPDLKALFDVVGRMHNIDAHLLEAIAEVESGGDPLSVSPKGAMGLMQLMPGTASAFSVLDPFDPLANVMGAADFLDYLRNRFASNLNLQGLPALLAAYNAGPRAVERYGGVPPYAETHNYVRKVMERYAGGLDSRAPAPVLILGPKPYLIQLTPGSSTAQPEPVLINVDGDGSENQLAAIGRRGPVLAAFGTGTAPWIRRAPIHNASQAEKASLSPIKRHAALK